MRVDSVTLQKKKLKAHLIYCNVNVVPVQLLPTNKKICILILYTYVFDTDPLISYELFLLQTNIIISAFKNPLLVDLYSLLIRSAQRSIFTVIVQGNEPELCVTYW